MPDPVKELQGFIADGTPDADLLARVDFDRCRDTSPSSWMGTALGAHASLPRVAGHRAGIAAVRDVVEASARLGCEVLTLYAFSVENWKRRVWRSTP